MKADPVTRERAKALRRELTDAERILWSRLKGERLGWRFRVQHPVAPYILDFACVRLKLGVEIDGATHSTLDEQAHDEARRSFLEQRGWTVIRFWNRDKFHNLDGVLRLIAEYLPPPDR